MRTSSELRVGEWVQVKSKEEILQTLDKSGQLEGLPFMPEMFAFCGKRFRVYKRAHKTCDPPNGMDGRGMLHAVHLEELRCDGAAHGGCQAKCLIFWKDSWLTKVSSEYAEGAFAPQSSYSNGAGAQTKSLCSEQDVVAGTRCGTEHTAPQDLVYICQSTHMAQATYRLKPWDINQYIEDYTSGNVRLSQFFTTAFVFVYSEIVSAAIGVGAALRWIYDSIQKMRGGTLYPWRTGEIPRGVKTPTSKLDVKPGDLVKIRSYKEILGTIDEAGFNRGMSFDAEMVPFCGGTYRVLDRVTNIINEKTGKMLYMKNDCIMLDNVVCKACFSKYRRFCPRSIFPYWREIWLERVGQNGSRSTVETETQVRERLNA